jgi:hypothetical protein
MVADEAQTPLGVKVVTVEADDAGGFLAAMLERVEAKRRKGRRVRMAEDAEHAAFLMQAILFEPGQALIVSLNCVGHARPRLP